jgi:hypothetical protein
LERGPSQAIPARHAWLIEVCPCMACACKAFFLKTKKGHGDDHHLKYFFAGQAVCLSLVSSSTRSADVCKPQCNELHSGQYSIEVQTRETEGLRATEEYWEGMTVWATERCELGDHWLAAHPLAFLPRGKEEGMTLRASSAIPSWCIHASSTYLPFAHSGKRGRG